MPASPTGSMSSSRPSRSLIPARTTAWSSTIRTRIGCGHASRTLISRRRRRYGKSATIRGPVADGGPALRRLACGPCAGRSRSLVTARRDADGQARGDEGTVRADLARRHPWVSPRFGHPTSIVERGAGTRSGAARDHAAPRRRARRADREPWRARARCTRSPPARRRRPAGASSVRGSRARVPERRSSSRIPPKTRPRASRRRVRAARACRADRARPSRTSALSKPVRRHRSSPRRRPSRFEITMLTCSAPECLTMFVSASWTTR